MINLVIGNSMSRLEGLTNVQMAKLRKILCYRVPGSFFGGQHRSRERVLIDRKGNFPTGLLYLVTAWRTATDRKDCTIITQTDTRKRPKRKEEDIFHPNWTHAPYLEQEQAGGAAQRYSRGIIVAPTGVGKSLITALIIQNLQVRTLVVVPKVELKRQTHETLLQIFGPQGMENISVENVDALDPNEVTDYDCVIIDEFHHAAAATYRKLNKKAWQNVYYRFGLTATPFRAQEDERLLLESVLSKVIYRVEYKDAVTKGYICPLEAYFIELPNRPVEGYTWAEVYKELVVDNDARNELINQLLSALHAQGVSTLCLVKEIAHGESLPLWPFANGQNEDTKHLITLFNRGVCKTLVGTTGVLGEGVDTKPCEYVVIAGLGKSKNQFMQQCGRAFRTYAGKESAKVIIFKDPSHKWTKAHFAAQVKILKEEYGVIPVKLTLT